MSSTRGQAARPHLNPAQAVAYLAERYQLEVGDEYLRRRPRDGSIAHTRLGRLTFFEKADLDAWVQRSRFPAKAS
jgi:excisionase family DNA binding protein